MRYLAWVILLLSSGGAFADVFRHADVHLRAGDEPGSVELSARLPDSLRDAAALQWPSGCRQTDSRQVDVGGQRMLMLRALCTRPMDRSAVIKAPWPLDGARLSIDHPGGASRLMLTPNGGIFEIPLGGIQAGMRDWLEIARGMLWQGLHHIGTGWDHLTFLLCLPRLL